MVYTPAYTINLTHTVRTAYCRLERFSASRLPFPGASPRLRPEPTLGLP